ncbi:GNVR domain-containing protein [Maritimibacter sp. DP1N21-5]|uniref:GumC family protein n=1 Tax=Maritimibacter sp. DP1N21-5 TaxID=2836867 RepID=UPI001C452B6D|nr:GNVR domain-containing protein [Maritimibacter sp. DP1N21-5]MBV7410694.1 hypothetical protein [Maritimibacter sp. DP1N21-5]
MTADTPEVQDDEIDLGELFASLWAYKSLIGGLTLGAIVAGGFYALNAEKIYTAEAVFKLEDSSNSGLSLPSEMSGLAALAGISGLADEGNVLFDRVRGRVFIGKVDEAVDLRGDDYFNTYDPDATDPLWKALIKRAIGYDSGELDPESIIEKNVVDTLRANFVIESTENGATSIKIDHTDPARAALIANAIMDLIVTETELDTDARQRSQLAYLSETLAGTLSEMEEAQARLKEFAIDNSTLSIEALARGSVALDQIRNRLERARELSEAADALLDAVESGNTNQATYLELRSEHPIIDDVEFRRVLGLSEIISEFTWPERELLAAVSATLRDSLERIARERARLEDEAISYAGSAEEQATLQREAEIAEASYTVLIEQVKAQSLLAGYTGETAQIFERAVPPLSPAKPNRMLVLALSGVLGVFLGSGVSLVWALRRGVFFSRRAFRDELNPTVTVPAGWLKKLNGRNLTGVQDYMSANRGSRLSDVAVSLRHPDTGFALVLGGRAKATARSAALGTALALAENGTRVAVVDLSRTVEPATDEAATGEYWSETQSESGVAEFGFAAGRKNADLLASSKFDAAIEALSSRHDLVIFSAEAPVAEMAAYGLSSLDPVTILVGRTGRTSKGLIHRLRSLKLRTILLLE